MNGARRKSYQRRSNLSEYNGKVEYFEHRTDQAVERNGKRTVLGVGVYL